MIELAAAISAGKGVGLPSLGSVLRAVSGYEDKQAKTLNLIQRDVRGLVMQQYNTGLDYLDSAARNEPDSDVSRQFLNAGLHALRQAAGTFEDNDDHYRGSAAALYLASTYSTVGPEREARHWAERAHQEATLAAEDAVKQANDRMDVRVGRISYLSTRTALVVLAAVFLYLLVGLAVELPHSYAGISLTSVGVGLLAYMTVRKWVRNVVSFLMFPSVRRWETFLESNREACAEIVGPERPLPRYKLSLPIEEGTPLGYLLVRVDDAYPQR
jgi:hypothetical protein